MSVLRPACLSDIYSAEWQDWKARIVVSRARGYYEAKDPLPHWQDDQFIEDISACEQLYDFEWAKRGYRRSP